MARAPAPGERIRGRRGQKLRRQRLEREPTCRLCAAEGIVKAATVPDHIQPLGKGGLDVDENVRGLCDDHHREVTAEEFGHKARPKIREDGRPEGWGD
jgi:5-methylcytosine-specific restriction enzyme A